VLENILINTPTPRRYTVGGNLAWITWFGTSEILDMNLKNLQLSGLRIIGSQGPTRIGVKTTGSFYKRIKKAVDPIQRWAEVSE
jgi:hypothetical protein